MALEEEPKATPAHIPVEVAREIARQGEERLRALMSLATAADFRATTLCGIFGAGAIATVAATLAYVASEGAAAPLIWSGGVMSAGLFIAAIITAQAGAPRDFYISGGNPDTLREWSWDAGNWRSEVDMLDATASRYAQSINRNREVLASGSRRVIWALWVAGASPFMALIAFAAASCI